jgi:TfoX/Sxy family transcriptional regulator of competence genes
MKRSCPQTGWLVHSPLLATVAVIVVGSACLAVKGEAAPSPSAVASGSSSPSLKGKFKAVYTPVKDKEHQELQKELKKEKLLELLAEDLNDSLKMPKDVTLTFAECGEANAFYESEGRKVTMCYELLDDLYEIFSKEEKDEDVAFESAFNATMFVFYHEVGHALVDVLDLPITGKEEDAVDQLSTLILADGTDEGEEMVIDGARWFYLEGEKAQKELDDSDFWDEHSLDKQRFSTILGMLYGQDPKKHKDLVKDGIIPKERAEYLEAEYERIEKAWGRLLKPYLKH